MLAFLTGFLVVPFNLSWLKTLPPVAAQTTGEQTTDEQRSIANQLVLQGVQQWQAGQVEDCLQSWQQALQIYRKIQHPQGEGVVLENLGTAYVELKDYQKAADFLRQALEIVRTLQNRESEKDLLSKVGRAYRLLGDHTRAIEYHQQYLLLARALKDRQDEALALGNLALSFDALGQYRRAIDYYQQALLIAQELKHPRLQQSALVNLGEAYLSLEDYARAIQYFTRMRALSQQIEDRAGERRSLQGMGSAYYFLADYPNAIQNYQQSLAIARSLKNLRGESDALRGLGNVHYYLNDFPRAIDFYQQSLAIERQLKNRLGEGLALGNIGLAYVSLGEYEKAIEYLQQDVEITREFRDRPNEGQALGNLGNAYYAQGAYPTALKYYQQSLAIAQEVNYQRGVGIMLNNIGATLLQMKRFSEAEKALQQGMQVLESLRDKVGDRDALKISIFEQQRRTYRLLQEAMVAQARTNEALEIAERSRARAFVELLSRRLATSAALEDHRPAPSESVASPTIAQMQQIARAQNATLVQYSIITEDIKVRGKWVPLVAELFVWVIQPTGEIAFRRVDLKSLWQQNLTLSDLVVSSREAIGARSRSDIAVTLTPERLKLLQEQQTRNLKQLYQLLIQPIASLLPSDPSAHVVFIPQDSLFLVPFPALQDARGNYLIEKHTPLTAPSIQVLALTRQQRLKQQLPEQSIGNQVPGTAAPPQSPDLSIPPPLLIIGNPTMPRVPTSPGKAGEPLSSLPGAEKEAQEVAALFNTQPLLGQRASKIAVVQQMPQANLIHLATHGLLDDLKGLGIPGAIALAPTGSNQPGNGLLTADEILDLNLRAELAVLSACDTGRGRITGDGVIGLSRAFISAGVPSVVVSLWAIPDAPTASLMKRFYVHLQQHRNKAQALRQAMLETKQQYPQPSYWAAFTLIGEAQ